MVQSRDDSDADPRVMGTFIGRHVDELGRAPAHELGMVSPRRRSILYKINGSPSGCLWLWVCVKTKVVGAESAGDIGRYDDGIAVNFDE